MAVVDENRVGIVVLNLNGSHVIRGCLTSIDEANHSNRVVVVVDNGSTDDSAEIVRTEFPSYHLIQNRQNVGVAEGQNMGIRRCMELGVDYVLVLNNDLVLDRQAIVELLKYSQDPGIGVSGPVMYSSANPRTVQSAGGIIDWRRGTTRHLSSGEIDPILPSLIDIDYMGLPFFRAELIDQVGFFDENYFAYWEDVDFCTRAKRLGYRIVTVTGARIWHVGSFTTRRMSGFVSYYRTRNRFLFMKRYSRRRQYLVFLISFVLFEFWYEIAVNLAYANRGGSLRSFIRGAFDGLMSTTR